MIPRYSRAEMTRIWEPENKFKIWLEIETLACEKMADLDIIPKHIPALLREKGGFDIARIDEIEREVKHDVIAFLTSVAEHIGPDSRYVHQGLTSSDILDTSQAVQLTQSADLLLQDLEGLLAALERRIKEHATTVCVGRSHGIHAEPTTFGIKLAGHYAAFGRALARLKAARAEIAVCAMSGAVGTYATAHPDIEAYVAEKLGFKRETISTQVIPRDRHAMFFATLGVIASSIENLAIEIRHLQRSEVREAEEYFSAGQKGSSAMPHKRNPVLTENLTGLARVIRASVIPALENVALWHERDISHSAVERTILPDALVALDFSLVRLTGVVENLLVYPERMQKNLDSLGGLVYSQAVLLALTQKGVVREDAYRLVQKAAMQVWECDAATSFISFLSADPEVAKHLSEAELKDICKPDRYLKHAPDLIARAIADVTAQKTA